jgi:tetratricopeptide (TPR) repeat protein
MLSPDDHFAWHEYGCMLLYDVGNIEDAEEALLRAQTLDNACGTVDQDIGLIRHVQGRNDAARDHFERSLEIDSDNADAWRAYGQYLYMMHADTALVEEAFERAIELTPDNFENWALYAGFLKECEERGDDAEFARTKAEEVVPETIDLDIWTDRALRPLILTQKT